MTDGTQGRGGPLAGIRVVDLTAVAMGPLATQTLGDMGADIVKVESAQGDIFRHATPGRTPGMGAGFLNFNRNKRSVVLDLKTPAGAQTLRELVQLADVLVCSLRPASMRRLGIDEPSIRPLNPRLIHCGVYGFSERGPYAGRPAYDDVIQAMSGLCAIQAGAEQGEPAYVKAIVADKVAGIAASGAIAMALYERERSGLGQAIEVPMFETLVAFNLLEHLNGASFEPPLGQMGYARLQSAHRRPYATRDGHIALMPYSTAQWQRFFEIADRPDMADDPRVMDPQARSRSIDTLYGLLAGIVAMRTTAQWLEVLAGEDIPHAPVRTLPQLLDDEHLRAVGLLQSGRHETEGTVRTIGIPVTFSRTPGSVRRLAPRLGSHGGDEILREWRAASSAQATGTGA